MTTTFDINKYISPIDPVPPDIDVEDDEDGDCPWHSLPPTSELIEELYCNSYHHLQDAGWLTNQEIAIEYGVLHLDLNFDEKYLWECYDCDFISGEVSKRFGLMSNKDVIDPNGNHGTLGGNSYPPSVYGN